MRAGFIEPTISRAEVKHCLMLLAPWCVTWPLNVAKRLSNSGQPLIRGDVFQAMMFWTSNFLPTPAPLNACEPLNYHAIELRYLS